MGRQNTNLQIIVEGKDEGAATLLNDLNKTAVELDKVLQEVGKGNASPELLDQLTGIQGKLGDIQTGFAGIGASATTGSAAAVSALGGVAIAAGGVVAALIATATAAISFVTNAVNMWAALGETVDLLQDATGASAEFASVLVTVSEIAGIAPDQLARFGQTLVNNVQAAAEAQAKTNADIAQANAALLGTIEDLEQTHTERVGALREGLAEQQAELLQRREQAEARANERLEDVERAHGQRVADLGKQEADTRADLARDIANQESAFNKQREDEAAQLMQRLARIEASRADDVADAQSRIRGLESDTAQRRDELVQASAGTVAKLESTITRTQADAIREREDLDRRYNQKATDLASDLADTRREIAEREAEKQADIDRRLTDNAERLSERLRGITQKRDEDIANQERNAVDLQQSFANSQAERQEKLADRLKDLSESGQTKREATESRIATARDQFEAAALTAELAAFNARETAKQAEIEKQVADEEAKAQAAFDKKLARINESIAAEKQAAEEATAAAQAEADKRAKQFDDQLAREKAAIAADGAERIADLQERIKRENDEYERQRDELKRQDDLRLADLRARIAGEKGETTKQLAELAVNEAARLKALQDRIAAENAATAKQTADLKAEFDKRVKDEASSFAAAQAEIARLGNERLATIEERRKREQASYAESVGDLKAALTEQIKADEEAQTKLAATTQKRLDAEGAAYDASVESALGKLSKFLTDAEQRTTPAALAIKALGINFDEFIELAPDQKLQLILDKLGNMPDGFEKSRLAQQLFGEGAFKVNELADVYARHTLPEWIKKTDELNRLYDGPGVKAALNYQQGLRELRLEGERTSKQVGKDLVDDVTRLNEKFEKFVETLQDRVLPFIEEKFVPALETVIDVLTRALELADKIAEKGLGSILPDPGTPKTFEEFLANLQASITGTPRPADQSTQPVTGGASATTNYIVNATYTQAAPPSPAEITRTLTLLNP